MTPRQPWPVHPPLEEGEWLGSWLRRVAAANMATLHNLLHDLGSSRNELVGLPTPALLASLAGRTVQPVAELVAAAEPPSALLTSAGRRGETPKAFLGVHLMQLCPECLAGDEVPYIRRSWLDRHEVHCQWHQRRLLDSCPHCDAQLRASFDVDETWRRESEGTTVGTDPVATCYFCRGDLRQQVHADPVDVHVLPASERFMRPGSGWDGFLRAFEDFVALFGLSGLVHVDQLVLGPEPVRADTWVHGNTGQLRHVVAERREIRMAAALTTTWLVTGDVSQRLKPFAKVALIESESSTGWVTSRPQLVRLWLLQALLDLSPRDLRLMWPQLLAGALAYIRRERTEAQAFSLTDEQWAVVEEMVSPAGNWNASNGVGSWRSLDRRTALDEFLTSLGRGSGITSSTAFDGKSLWHLITRLSDGAQLGFALGLLYRHLNASKVQTRKRRGRRPATYADWQLQTEQLFLSDGMIELTRRVNASLHRKLVGRVLLQKE